MNFAVILEFATFISFVVVLLGGVQQRSYGWKLVCTLLTLVALIQAVGMSLVVSVCSLLSLKWQSANLQRHMCMTTTNDSFRAGNWIFLGCCVLSAGHAWDLLPLVLALRNMLCLTRAVMSSFAMMRTKSPILVFLSLTLRCYTI